MVTNMHKKITKAIIPVAGLGTRFLPATKAQPKEMLPIVDKPAIQFLVEEAASSGIEEIIFVTGKGKRAIEDHFDSSPELEEALEQKGKSELAREIRAISALARFSYVRQREPKGDGDAILTAAHLIGNEPVAVMFGDCVYDSKTPALRQLLDSYERFQAPIIGLTEIPRSEVSKFGVIGGNKIDAKHWEITSFVEKPKPEEALSTIVAPGKYIITPAVVGMLTALSRKELTGELRLADAFSAMLASGEKLFGRMMEGEWLDCGSKIGFLKATVRFGLSHPETKVDFRKFLKGVTL